MMLLLVVVATHRALGGGAYPLMLPQSRRSLASGLKMKQNDLVVGILVWRRFGVEMRGVWPANKVGGVVLIPVWLIQQRNARHLFDHHLLDASHRLLLCRHVVGLGKLIEQLVNDWVIPALVIRASLLAQRRRVRAAQQRIEDEIRRRPWIGPAE